MRLKLFGYLKRVDGRRLPRTAMAMKGKRTLERWLDQVKIDLKENGTNY